jgi:hypothetical protein
MNNKERSDIRIDRANTVILRRDILSDNRELLSASQVMNLNIPDGVNPQGK